MKICWTDLETTGLDEKKDKIIELALIYQEDDDVPKQHHIYCKPETKPMNWEFIEELTGITWDILEKNGMSELNFYNAINTFLTWNVDKYDKEDKMIFAGYNCKFDNNFLRELYLRNGNKYFGSLFINPLLDVMSIIADRTAKGQIPIIQNYKLENVYKTLLKKDFKVHSALEDIKATKELYEFLDNMEVKK